MPPLIPSTALFGSRKRPQPRREPGIEHVGILLYRTAALGAGGRVGPGGPLVLAFDAGEYRNAVAPPQLAGDVPVADVLHPVLERGVPALGDDLGLVVRSEERRVGEECRS